MRTILVAVDLSSFTEFVLDEAAWLAADGRAALHLLHVIPPPSGFEAVPASATEIDRRIAEEDAHVLERLAALARDLSAGGATVESFACVRGEPADEIVARATECKADLVVVGANAKGPLVRTVLGSVSSGVLARAGRPVLVVPAPESAS